MTIYYVDNDNGSDTNSGLSLNMPWKTIFKINNYTFFAGDAIFLKRNSIWREQLIIPQSGLIFDAYGSGSKPKLLGSVVLNSVDDWQIDNGNLWKTSGSLTDADIGNLIFNGELIIGFKKDVIDDVLVQGDFYYNPITKILYLYSVSNPATFYTNIECVRSMHGVVLDDKNDLTIRNLDVRYFGKHGIVGSSSEVGKSDNILIEHCNVSYAGGSYLYGTTRYGNGIESWNWGSNWTVRYNSFDNIYDAAITTQGDYANNAKSNQFFYYNLIRDSEYSFELWNRDATASLNNIRFDNNTCLNAGNLWGHAQRSDQDAAAHLSFYDSSCPATNIFIRNNIFYESVVNCARYHTWNDFENVTFDNNLYFQASGAMIRFTPNARASYTMAQFTDYQSVEDKDANSFTQNPIFKSDCDFHIKSTSPCVGKGANVGLTRDYDGIPVKTLPDIGAYEYIHGMFSMAFN
jgi:hypothetical protein